MASKTRISQSGKTEARRYNSSCESEIRHYIHDAVTGHTLGWVVRFDHGQGGAIRWTAVLSRDANYSTRGWCSQMATPSVRVADNARTLEDAIFEIECSLAHYHHYRFGEAPVY